MADTNQSERDLFEATLGGSRVLMRATDDSYVSMYVQNDWEVWQVARATLATPAPGAPGQEAAAVQAVGAKPSISPSDAEIVLSILDGGGWELHRSIPWEALTDEANERTAWFVKRTQAPYGDGQGGRQWCGPSAIAAFVAGYDALKMKFPAALPPSGAGEKTS